MFYIYGLTDPDTKIIRYVGQTNNLQRRFQNHLHEARSTSIPTRKLNWLRSLIKQDKVPDMIIIEELSDRDSSNQAEVFHIAQLLDLGFDLTNATGGGDGFYNMSPESIERGAAKKRGRKASEETRNKMSLAHKQRFINDPSLKDKLSQRSKEAGCIPPNSRGEKVSNSKLKEKDVIYIRRELNSGNKTLTQIHKEYNTMSLQCVHLAAIGKSWAHVKEPVFKPRKNVKLTDSDVIEIKRLLAEGNLNQPEIAKMFDISQSTISDIKRNKRRNNIQLTTNTVV